jgi:hypothetical protein
MGVRITHPDLDAEIVVPESAVPFHRAAGWQLVEDDAPVTDSLDGMTVPQLQTELRSRDLPVSGTKPELLARLRSEPEPAEPAAEEEAEPEQEEPGEAAEQTSEESD